MKATDPVCGMQIDIEKAAAREEHGGWAYFFCSASCHRLFKEAPQRYAERHEKTGAEPRAATGADRDAS